MVGRVAWGIVVQSIAAACAFGAAIASWRSAVANAKAVDEMRTSRIEDRRTHRLAVLREMWEIVDGIHSAPYSDDPKARVRLRALVATSGEHLPATESVAAMRDLSAGMVEGAAALALQELGAAMGRVFSTD